MSWCWSGSWRCHWSWWSLRTAISFTPSGVTARTSRAIFHTCRTVRRNAIGRKNAEPSWFTERCWSCLWLAGSTTSWRRYRTTLAVGMRFPSGQARCWCFSGSAPASWTRYFTHFWSTTSNKRGSPSASSPAAGVTASGLPVTAPAQASRTLLFLLLLYRSLQTCKAASQLTVPTRRQSTLRLLKRELQENPQRAGPAQATLYDKTALRWFNNPRTQALPKVKRPSGRCKKGQRSQEIISSM